MNNRIRSILEDLEAVRENLLALSDDIWLSIDHNDPDALDRGYEFKKNYNDKLQSFGSLAAELSELVQQFTEVQIADTEEGGSEDETINTRIVQELNKEEPHHIEEDFTYRRPYGFILQGQAVTGVVTWKRFYTRLLQVLHRQRPTILAQLPDDADHITNRGNHYFSKDSDQLSEAMEIADGVYADTHMSANSFRNSIKRLLDTYGIPGSELQIFLREDRDAGRERESGQGE